MDSHSKLFDAMRFYHSLDNKDEILLKKSFKEKHFKKGELLLKQSEVADKVFFIVKGCTHQFFILESGDVKSCNFSFENDFITDIESFGKKQPSDANIEALKDVEALYCTCDDLALLLEVSHNISNFFRIIMESVALEGTRRTKSLLAESPETRFANLLKKEPDLFQKVPQKLIAQYLGILPESLSRIKRRMHKS